MLSYYLSKSNPIALGCNRTSLYNFDRENSFLSEIISQCLLSANLGAEIIGHSLTASIHNPKHSLAAVNGAEINLEYSVVNGTCWNLSLKCVCQEILHLGSWDKRNKIKTDFSSASICVPRKLSHARFSTLCPICQLCPLARQQTSFHSQPAPHWGGIYLLLCWSSCGKRIWARVQGIN